MNIEQSAQFYQIHSDYLAAVFSKRYPMITFLGVESGGRNRNHLDKNLLRPGAGGFFGASSGTSQPDWSLPRDVHILSDGIRYSGVSSGGEEASLCDCSLRMVDDYTLVITMEGKEIAAGTTIFYLAFAPDMVPPSLWANPQSWDYDPTFPGKDIMRPSTMERTFDLPGLISLPDFGILKVESPDSSVIEEIVPDWANAGVNHGWGNTSHMNARKACHYGHIGFSFQCNRSIESCTIRLTVQEEIVPIAPGCDFSGTKWNGLRRCWMNSFTLNPQSLTLGDNPILDGLGHLSIHWKSDMSVYTPALLPGVTLHDFFRNALDVTFKTRTDQHGRMSGYGWENGGCNLIALDDYLRATDDREFAGSHIVSIRKIIEYNLDKDADNDGILEAAHHGRHNDSTGRKVSFNWFDVFAFGHKDAYANLIYHQAFRRIKPVLEDLGQTDLSVRIESFLAKARESFHETFYNPATGVYASWIDIDGKIHDYYFTPILGMAITEGLVPDQSTARVMMSAMLDKLEENGYGDFTYGVPAMAVPIDKEDRITWAPMADWGNYIHGGFCGMPAYHFLMGLYRAGMREKADEILFKMIDFFENNPTHSGLHPGFGIGKSWDWRTRDGLPSGYNYLADNYVFLLAAIQGHFDVGTF